MVLCRLMGLGLALIPYYTVIVSYRTLLHRLWHGVSHGTPSNHQCKACFRCPFGYLFAPIRNKEKDIRNPSCTLLNHSICKE